MTVLSVATDVCKVIGLDVPDALVSSTQREYVELAATMQEMATRIAEGHEWTLFARQKTYTGDGSTEDFDLPDDYDRMPVKANLWSSSLETALSHISDLDRWLELDVQSFDFVINAWTIYGGQMHIKPALATGVTAKHWYQSNLIFAPTSGANKAAFSADDDKFRLSEKLWTLGTIYQWRMNKGQPYAENMADYEELKARLVTRDKGSRIIRSGKVRMPADAHIAYPQSITGV
jgi:hypothetical protein